MRFVADRGGLTTDPQLDSYYLWDLMLSGSIYGAEYANELRGYALPVVARGSSTVDEDAMLLTLARQLQFTGAVVDRDSSSMFRYNPALKSSIGDALSSASDTVAKLNQTGQGDLTGKLDARTLPDSAASASNAYYQLFDRSQKILTDLVTTRIAGLNSQKTTQLGSILLVALLAIALVYWIWRGINRQVNSMTLTFAKISEGDLRARADVLGKDELGRLAISLNNMADNTLSLVQGREERDKIQQNITKLLEEVSGVADGDLRRKPKSPPTSPAPSPIRSTT